MEQLLLDYLVSYTNCPLPAIGSLQIRHEPATVVAGDNIITAPRSVIYFDSKEISADRLLEFIARKRNVSISEASGMLSNFCNRLQEMDAYNEIELLPAGKFYIDADGSLQFKQVQPGFSPAVPAVRVIHPQQSHTMLVGDTETDTAAMTAFYTADESAAKSRWWIWPLVLFVAATLVLVFYISDDLKSNSFGNATKASTNETGKTYRSIP
ncbi:MAG: hypothetical protein ABIY51_15805 [Ferruginibacter sp.]